MNSGKIALFDMDGTLCAPWFKKSDGEFTVGFSQDEWIKFCDDQKEKAYEHCVPIIHVLGYANHLVDNDVRCELLTVTMSEGERLAKRAYLDERRVFTSIFKGLKFVNTPEEKLDYMEKLTEKYDRKNILIVEDDLSIIFKAIERGFNAIHVSNIVAASRTTGVNDYPWLFHKYRGIDI